MAEIKKRTVPNDPQTRKNNFIVKVWDDKANNGSGDYRPIYILPDATDEIVGGVYLTDTANEKETATSGMTAISPAGVIKALEPYTQFANLQIATHQDMIDVYTKIIYEEYFAK